MADSEKGGIVYGIGLTHTPGLANQLDRAQPAQLARVMDGLAVGRRELAEARPDVIVAFINDHFDMFTLRNMPGFAIGLGDTHWGPPVDAEGALRMKRGPVPGHAHIAGALCDSLTRNGFELYRTDTVDFLHNVLLPKKYLWPDRDIPVVPIMINCFAPPLPSFRRAYQLGLAVREVLEKRSEKIAVIASGGLSHWPPILPDDKADALYNARIEELNNFGRAAASRTESIRTVILKREIEMSQSDKALINATWDLDFMERLARADVEHLTALDHDDVCRDAGPGGAEMLLWVALMGTMNARPGNVVMYEAVTEWMGGVGVLSYVMK